MVFSANIGSKKPQKTLSESWILRYGSEPAAQTKNVEILKNFS